MIGLPGETRRGDQRHARVRARAPRGDAAPGPACSSRRRCPGRASPRMAERERGQRAPARPRLRARFQQRPRFETEHVALDGARAASSGPSTSGSRRRRGPKKVIMNVTYKCNNRCTFCATGTRTQFDGDFERQRELLVKYRQLGVDAPRPRRRRADAEPEPRSAHPLRAAHRLREGQRHHQRAHGELRRSSPEKLVRSGVTSILVLHPRPRRADARAERRRRRGVRADLRGRAQPACASRRPGVELGANITLTKSNYEQLGEVAELILGLGLRWFNIQFLTPFGRATSSVAPDTQAAADVSDAGHRRVRGPAQASRSSTCRSASCPATRAT